MKASTIWCPLYFFLFIMRKKCCLCPARSISWLHNLELKNSSKRDTASALVGRKWSLGCCVLKENEQSTKLKGIKTEN